jgi:hypothetical protein
MQNITDLLADGGAARFAGGKYNMSPRAEVFHEIRNMRRLA